MKEFCYSCGAEATSREHVPPKCIFPKGHREKLITVPSCDEHNSKKSKDDEYLRCMLSCAAANNNLSMRVIEDSILPSINRRPQLAKSFFQEIRPLKVGTVETGTVLLDLSRFNRAMTSISQGLYFYAYGKRLEGKANTVWELMMHPDTAIPLCLGITSKVAPQLPPINRGTNPEIFTYAIDHFPDRGVVLFRFRFFEGHPIYVLWNFSRNWIGDADTFKNVTG